VAPPVQMRTVTYGGREIEVPKGVDPGWAYAPGGGTDPTGANAPLFPAAPDASPDKAVLMERKLKKATPDLAGKVREELEAAAKEAKAAEAKAKEEAEAKAKEEAEAKAKEEAEKAKADAEAEKAKAEADAKAKEEAGKAKADAEAEKVKTEADAKAKEEAEKTKAEADAREKDRAERAERIKKLEEKAKKLEEKAKKLQDECDKKLDEYREQHPSHSGFYTPPDIKKLEKSVNAAWAKLDTEMVKALGESLIQEILDATGKLYTNPLLAKNVKSSRAYFTYADRTITLSTYEKIGWFSTEPIKCSDGGGFYVDRETLEKINITRREHMKMVIAHELCHDGHGGHGPDFHETMYNFLCKVFPDYTKQLYVWEPVGKEGTDYVKWEGRPNQIDYATWVRMREEKKKQEEKGDE